jgi:ASC-1-like (ASCH) protein
MNNTHSITIHPLYFKLIKKGKKTIEGTLNKNKFSTFKKNDLLKIINNKNENDIINAKIRKIIKYNSFEEYLSQEGLKRTLPDVQSIEDGVNIYYKFYNKNDEEKYGVLAIYIKILN